MEPETIFNNSKFEKSPFYNTTKLLKDTVGTILVDIQYYQTRR